MFLKNHIDKIFDSRQNESWGMGKVENSPFATLKSNVNKNI